MLAATNGVGAATAGHSGMSGMRRMPATICVPTAMPLWPAVAAPTPLVAASMLALGLLCGAVAYLLYFRLVADIGATGALTVTYLIPVFGVLWGALFLGEAVSLFTLAGAYMKRWASAVPARGMAVGTQLVAGILLIPFIPLVPPTAVPDVHIVASMLALGLVCGAVAYLLYFRLVADIGATGALTVTYLIPVFGVLWGALFLGEAVTMPMIAGGVLVILGTVLVLRT